jgi:hypothetical protein
MKKPSIYVALILALSVPLSAYGMCNKWTSTDTALAATVLVPLTIDWSQTRQIAKGFTNPRTGNRVIESNKLLGPLPSTQEVDRHFVAGVVLTGAVACLLPPEYRRPLLTGIGVVELGFILHNRKLGLSLSVTKGF